MKLWLTLFSLFPTLIWAFDLCPNVTCPDGNYTEIVGYKVPTCPTELVEIQALQEKAQAVYDFDEESGKWEALRHARKKEAKGICTNIKKIEDTIKKGLILDSKIVELKEEKAEKARYLERFKVCSYCQSESGGIDSINSEPHKLSCNGRNLKCN